MDVSTRQEDGHVIVTVAGEVDLYTSPKMREALFEGIADPPARIIVDLSGVSYMDSSGIATLVEALRATRKAAGRLVLAGLTDRVREVLELARLETEFELSPDVPAALESAGGS